MSEGTTHLGAIVRALALRYKRRAERCRKVAKKLTDAADVFDRSHRLTFTERADAVRPSARLHMENMWTCMKLYREYQGQLAEGARNTICFADWLKKIYEVRHDDFGNVAEDLVKEIGYRDFTTFTELAMFLREKQWPRGERVVAQRLYAMWVCFKHEIGINPIEDFYRLEDTRPTDMRLKLVQTATEL